MSAKSLPDNKLYLRHTLDACSQIAEFLSDIDKQDFLVDARTQNAVMYQLSIVAESLSKTTQDLRDSHPEIEWRDIKDMRNLVLHDYDNVNIHIVWDTVQQDIPVLKSQVQEILSEIS
jgi:uncharacterized protein with HEPN domain